MPTKPHDIVGLGVIAVDDMLYVANYPSADAKVPINARRRQGGGNTSSALASAARLGSRCAVLGRLGDDDLSRFAREHLAAAGVDLSLLLQDPQSGPIYCVIVVSSDTGSRTIYVDDSAVRPLQPSELSSDWFHGARILLVDHLYPPTILPAVRMARDMGLEVVSDIERNIPELSEFRQYIDHMICSEEFAVSHAGVDGPREACRALARSGRHRTVVVTAGRSGCYWCTSDRSEVAHLPAQPVEPVDTTGCGDVFHGAFCHGLVRGWPIDQTIRFANAAAGIKAGRTGGWAATSGSTPRPPALPSRRWPTPWRCRKKRPHWASCASPTPTWPGRWGGSPSSAARSIRNPTGAACRSA